MMMINVYYEAVTRTEFFVNARLVPRLHSELTTTEVPPLWIEESQEPGILEQGRRFLFNILMCVGCYSFLAAILI